MNYKKFLSTFEGMQTEQKWTRIFLGGLIVIILMLSFMVSEKETIVVIKPWALAEDAMLEKSASSQAYKEAWGFSLSQLIGNVNPSTVSFISERLGPLLSPQIYQDVIDVLNVQSQEIKIDRISMRFEPRFVEYEEKTNKVFVNGYSFIKGTASKEKRSPRTYEFIINIANYAPVVTFIDVYSGKPRTKSVLEKMDIKEERRKEREKQNASQ